MCVCVCVVHSYFFLVYVLTTLTSVSLVVIRGKLLTIILQLKVSNIENTIFYNILYLKIFSFSNKFRTKQSYRISPEGGTIHFHH